MKTTVRNCLVLFVLITLAVSCMALPEKSSSAPESITIDGSSTVFLISQKAAKLYQRQHPKQVDISVNFSGTGGGFKKFCAGETDINNASRPIATDEIQTCQATGVEYIELPVAFDALTIVVHRDNTWVDRITLEELKKIWEPAAERKITRWNQIRETWPQRPLNLFGPGSDSGTFDYFTQAIVGESGSSRNDYSASEDDNQLVEKVSQEPNALGYFGLGYYAANWEKLKSLAVDSGQGPVQPTIEAVTTAKYQPLTRPLFIYVNAKAVENKPQLKSFVQDYLENVRNWVSFVGYVPLSEQAYKLTSERFQQGKLGTVYAGELQTDLTIEQLLQR